MKKNNRNQHPSARRPESGEPRGDQRQNTEEQARRARRNEDVPMTPDSDGELESREQEGEDEDEALERP
jgi:hypothetical protein